MKPNAVTDSPMISIVVPVYNAQDSIARTLELLQAQTHENIEIVCVNDGSSDSTLDILNDASRLDARIKVIDSENQGAYKARMLGIDCAQGDYIGFCDADDEPMPRMFEKMLSLAIETDADIVVSAFHRCSENRILSTEMQWGREPVREIASDSGWIASVNPAFWNKLFKSSVVKQHVALDKPPRMTEDALFLLSVLPSTKTMAFVPEALYKYNYPKDSSTNHLAVDELENLFRCWEKTRSFVLAQDPSLSPIFDWSAFVHLGVSCTLSLIKAGHTDKETVTRISSELDDFFPEARNSPFSKFAYLERNRDTSLLPYLANKLYKRHLLVPALKTYQRVIAATGKELKW